MTLKRRQTNKKAATPRTKEASNFKRRQIDSNPNTKLSYHQVQKSFKLDIGILIVNVNRALLILVQHREWVIRS